ncbi:hypothetical protein MASR2M117_03690 [Paludibacter sp.]
MTYNKITLFIFLTLIFLSCHDLVDDKFSDFVPVPVMNGLLQADSTFMIQISLAANLSDTMPGHVKDALVIIESQGEAPDTLQHIDEGWYGSTHLVRAGASYTCTAKIPGFNTITARTTVPSPTEIDSIVFTDLAGRGEEGEKISSVAFRLHNDMQNDKFWEVKLNSRSFGSHYDWEIDDFIEGWRIEEKYIFMRAGQDSVLLNEANPLMVFSNHKMQADKHWIKVYFNEFSNSFSITDTLFVELRSIDKSYYNYRKQYYIYESAQWGRIGTSPQRYPLYSNVTNGLGVFMSSAVTRKDVMR